MAFFSVFSLSNVPKIVDERGGGEGAVGHSLKSGLNVNTRGRKNTNFLLEWLNIFISPCHSVNFFLFSLARTFGKTFEIAKTKEKCRNYTKVVLGSC